MKRPMSLIAMCYLGGLLLGHYALVPADVLGVGTLIALLLSLWYLWHPSRSLVTPLLTSLSVCGAGALWYNVQVRVLPETSLHWYTGGPERLTVTGIVDHDPETRPDYTLVSLAADSVRFSSSPQWAVATGRLLIRLRAKTDCGAFGDRVQVFGWLRSPAPARNPGGFDAEGFYTRQGVYGLMSVQDTLSYHIRARRSSITFHTAIILPIRLSIERTIDTTLHEPYRSLLKGLLLGQRQNLPEDLLQDFSLTGLTHLLSVSGLHVGLIILITLTVFSVIRLRPATVTLSTLVVLILYAFLTNLTPSVVRASIMGGLFLIGGLFDRQTDGINILSVAALLILIAWPSAVFDLSFQLSFIATLSILAGYPRLRSLLPERARRSQAWWALWIRDGLMVSVAAQVGTAPLIAATFFQTSLISPVANLFVGPLVFVATSLGVLAALTGPVSLTVAGLFNATNWLALKGIVWITALFARVPFASIPIAQPSLAAILVFYALSLLLVKPLKDRKERWFLVVALVSGVLAGVWYSYDRPDQMEITILDVGQGDAVFVAFPNGKTMLIDGGPKTPEYDAGARVVLPFLRSKGYHRIDTVIASHPHTDHYGGLTAVLDAVEVGEVITDGYSTETPMFREWEQAVLKHRIRYRTAMEGDRLQGLGEVEGMILHPTEAFMSAHSIEQANDASVVIKLAYGQFSMLFCGDIEADAEHALVERYPGLRATVLKTPHHGSSTSSGPAFVSLLNPEAAIISVGERNAFRHPSAEVVHRLQQQGTTVYRTDQSGAVSIRTDGSQWEIDVTLSLPRRQEWLTPRLFLDSICLTEWF